MLGQLGTTYLGPTMQKFVRFVEENGHQQDKKHTEDEEAATEATDLVESEREVILPSGPVSFEVELHADEPRGERSFSVP